MSRIVIVTLLHHGHKPIDHIKMTLMNVGRKMGVTSLGSYSEVGFDVKVCNIRFLMPVGEKKKAIS
jgi:hypothetical protein